MHLSFAHHGRQFFFLTICVRERRAVLSRLVEGESRPKLTRAGECVKALWLAIHGLNPALTAGEFVIMPDHVHLLLIVNYERDPGFKPLVFLHWFMEESERMIAASRALAVVKVTATDGGCTPEPPELEGAADCSALLPTSMRATYCPKPQPASASETAGRSSGVQPAGIEPHASRGSGMQPPSFAAFWDRRFWLDLSFDARQLAAIRRYIRGNPARAMWKRQHPDRFVCHSRIRHPILDLTLPWSACGDLTLLASPFLVAVSLTRKKALTEHEPEIAALIEKARQGWVIVCGFLSPGEKELARRLREEPRVRWIKTLAQGLPPRCDPSLADSRELAAGRMLILSALPVCAPFDWNTCHKMNDLASAMCRRARGENG